MANPNIPNFSEYTMLSQATADAWQREEMLRKSRHTSVGFKIESGPNADIAPSLEPGIVVGNSFYSPTSDATDGTMPTTHSNRIRRIGAGLIAAAILSTLQNPPESV